MQIAWISETDEPRHRKAHECERALHKLRLHQQGLCGQHLAVQLVRLCAGALKNLLDSASMWHALPHGLLAFELVDAFLQTVHFLFAVFDATERLA